MGEGTIPAERRIEISTDRAVMPVPRGAEPPPVRGRLVAYGVVIVVCLALALGLRSSSRAGSVSLHNVAETVAVLLALGAAALSLVRFYSRKTNTFLLLGAAFAGTAFLDGYHAFAFARSAADLSPAGPWSWFASRLFLAFFLWMNIPEGRLTRFRTDLDERAVYLLVGAVGAACFLFFTFTPLSPAYFPELPVRRPAELIPAGFFLLALVAGWRSGGWRKSSFGHWMALSLLLGFLGQTVFMPFSSRPFDAFSMAGHAAKILSYLSVLAGLLGNVYSLFRKADRSAAELARVNAALEAQARERELAEQERDRFFDISLDMLCIAGTDGYFKQLNAAWEKTLGYSTQELMARPYVDFVHPDDRGSTGREAQRLRLGGLTFDFENRYLAKDGTYRWLSWRSVPVPEQGLVYGVARDVNERKKVEQMKNDFISVVSHELRTPLTSIRGSLGLIAGGVAGEIPGKARALLDIAAKNSERLVRLINDMLDIEKIELGEMAFRFVPIELMPLVEQAVEANHAFAAKYEVELRIAEAPPEARVRADPDRLLQVLTNLLSNAAKFSPRGEAVEVAVSREGGRVSVSVKDRGRGISPEFQPRVFEKFAQADVSSTRDKEGTGLGLSISKAIVESHGGQLTFETGAGGTTFRFELPDWEGSVGADKEGGPRILLCEDGRNAARILHIEDDSDLQKVVAAIVNGDAAVESAANLEEARRWLVRERFDLVILDLALPDGSGAELLPLLGRLTPPTPVLIFSAYEVEPSTASQAASILVKSQTTNEELLEKIRACLGRASAP